MQMTYFPQFHLQQKRSENPSARTKAAKEGCETKALHIIKLSFQVSYQSIQDELKTLTSL